jgi:pimeloyl-ACP methyl ester carboxylesterase
MTSTTFPPGQRTTKQIVSHTPMEALEAAQAAVLARYAPGTRIRRVRWSHGTTQIFELGSGSPLLLVHGAFASGFYWAPILPALARNHRVLAFDLPGHGLADPFDYTRVDPLDHASTLLRDILDVLELRTVDVVANSMGGLWSAAFALDAPDRVSRLALVGAPAGVTRLVPIELRLLGLPLIGQPLGRRLMSDQSREGTRKFWGQLLVVHPEYLDDVFLDAEIAHARRNIDSMLSLVHGVANMRGLRRRLILGRRWQDLTMPTVLLCGERDRFIPARGWRTLQTIAAHNPRVHIVRVPAAGHLPWLDDAERIVGEIERFLVA